MKRLEDFVNIDKMRELVDDLHSLMWYADGCEVCAHCVVEQREPYRKTSCTLGNECDPLWRGFKTDGENERAAESRRVVTDHRDRQNG